MTLSTKGFLSPSLVLISSLVAISNAACPPEGLEAMLDFDVNKYVPARWYSVKQSLVQFQSANELYCTTAVYDFAGESFTCRTLGWTGLFGCDDAIGISVFNSGRRDSVTGPPIYINFLGTIPNSDEPAKASIAPTFVPGFLRSGTNYWVLDAGRYSDLVSDTDILSALSSDTTGDNKNYQYALVVAGPPDIELENGLCSANNGRWILTKDPELPVEVLDALEARFQGFRVDTTELLSVPQAGCDYDIQSSGNVYVDTFNTVSQTLSSVFGF